MEARLQSAGAFAAALLPFADSDTQKRYGHLPPAPGTRSDQAVGPVGRRTSSGEASTWELTA
jgi:hypothetical protein